MRRGRQGPTIRRRYRVALAGCGPRGRQHAYGLLSAPERFELAALCDIDGSRLEILARALGVSRTYRDAERMLDVERPDILVFATPPTLREPLVDLGVRHGVKAIACEKPLATSLPEARRIVDRCAEAGVRGVVCHQFRHGAHWQRVKEAAASGMIGDIRLIHATGRPSMLRVGTHLIDAVLWLAGVPVTWVLGQAHGNAAFADDHPGPDHIAGVAHLASGVRAFLEIGSLAPHHRPEDDYWGDVAVTVVGSLGHASVVLGGGWEIVPTGGRRNGGGPDAAPQEARHLTLLADWLDEPPAVHPANFAASYHGLEVLLGLALSSIERRRVTLPIVDGAGDVLGRLRQVLAETIPRERRLS